MTTSKWQTFLKYKIPASKAETAREFVEWYSDRWKKDYPDLYKMRYSTAFARRPVRPLSSRNRRRLMVTGRTKRRSRTYAKRKAALKFSHLGDPIRTLTTTKTTLSVDDADIGAKDSNELHSSVNLLQIVQGAQINQRERRLVNLVGLRFNLMVTNVSAQHLMFHGAIIAPKESNQLDVSNLDFFRGYNSNRGIDFNIGLNALDVAFRPINPDIHNILAHWSFKLGPGPGNYPESPFRILRRWIKIKRQITFESNAGDSCLQDIRFVYWCTSATSNGAVPVNAAILPSYNCIVHFTDPKP